MEEGKETRCILKPGERLDDLERNGYKIIQSPNRFCFGMDAVLLSIFAEVRKGEQVMDLGTGTGILPILLEAKTPGEHFTGLEIQEESADMARRSVYYNHLEKKIDIVCGDLKEAAGLFGRAAFDVVISNPPYMNAAGGAKSASDVKAIARQEILCTLEDVVLAAASLLKVGGRFYLVHRPYRLAEIIRVMSKYNLEPKRMRLVYPYVDREPTLVLLGGVKGARPMLKTEPPLIIYEREGVYSQEMQKIYHY